MKMATESRNGVKIAFATGSRMESREQEEGKNEDDDPKNEPSNLDDQVTYP